MYGLLMEINGGGNAGTEQGRSGRTRPVMTGLFALLGEQDAIVKAYKQQLVG